MLSSVEILILAAIQGISEFLPVSSAAHLVLVSKYYAFVNQSLLIDICLHLGSLLAIIFYFRNDLLNFIKTLEKELKIKAIRNYMPMQKGDVKQTLSDTNLLKKITGYNPKTKYQDGIKKFLDWYLEYYKKLKQ